jgi:hypothetical protein
LAGGLNLYGFANGDPINFSDPFGLSAVSNSDFEAGPFLVGAAIVGGVYAAYRLVRGAINLSEKVQKTSEAAEGVSRDIENEDIEGLEQSMQGYRDAQREAHKEGGKLATDAVTTSWTQGARRGVSHPPAQPTSAPPQAPRPNAPTPVGPQSRRNGRQ